MTWVLEVEDVSGDRDLLRAALSQNGYEITVEDRSWLLTHPEFSKIASAEEVRNEVSSALARLHAMAKLQAVDIGYRVGAVRKVNADGTTNRHVFVEVTANIQVEAHATAVIVESPDLSPEEREKRKKEAEREEVRRKREAIVRKLSTAVREPKVVDVAKLVAEDHLSMTQAGHIVDIVQDACGGDMAQFATSAELQRFHRSINHPAVMGLGARHAVSKQVPPPKPMTKDEALGFARRIGHAWIQQRERDT